VDTRGHFSCEKVLDRFFQEKKTKRTKVMKKGPKALTGENGENREGRRVIFRPALQIGLAKRAVHIFNMRASTLGAG
jgi:hypothetical protein